MVISFTKRKHFTKSSSSILSKVVLLTSLSFAVMDTVWSLYLYSFLNNASSVGFISGGMTLLSVLCFIFFTPIIERFSEQKLLSFGILGMVFGYLLFFIADNILIVLIAAIVLVISQVFHAESQGILVCDSCNKKEIGKTEGFVWAIRNLGWLIGPLIGGFVAANIGIPFVFVFCAIFAFMAFIVINTSKINLCNHKVIQMGKLISSLKNMKHFFSEGNLLKIYIISGGIAIYFGIIYIYTPLYIIQSGLPDYFVGLFLFAIVIPLVLLEYPLGKLADKKGYKKFFMWGYLIIAVFSLLSFLADNIYLSLSLLVLATVGAAFIEGNVESFFFKNIKKTDEERYYGPFRTHVDLFSLLGKLICAILLIFFNLHCIYLFLAVVMAFFAFFSLVIKENSKPLS